MSELQRASVMAVIEEDAAGTLKAPTAATDFIPMRSGGDEISPELEILENDELYNSIGATEPSTGKENPTASHSAYLKGSGVSGQAPNWAVLLESALGTSVTRSSTDTILAGTNTVSATVASGAAYQVGEAILSGSVIRNVASIATNVLNYNFAADDIADGSTIEKNYLVKPASSGHPSFSTWIYNGNGGLVQAMAGGKTSSVSIDFAAGQFVDMSFDIQGTSYYFNPIEITAGTSYIDFTDDGGTVACQVPAKYYKTPIELAEAISVAMNAVSTDAITVSYGNTTGKFTIAADGSTFSILWNTGTNTANTIASKIGFSAAADSTGALTYTSATAQSYAAPFTPDFDDSSNIVVKSNELFLGSQSDNVCVKASSGTLSIDNETVDIDSICSESGLLERLTNARSVTLSLEIVYDRHQAKYVDSLLQNKTISAMLNMGPKSGGNWVAGKCVNIYLPSAKVTSANVGGDDAVTQSLELQAFVTDSAEDIYINFV